VRKEYADDPGNPGMEVLDRSRISELCGIAARHGMQVVTHAIGDAAIDEMIGQYEAMIGPGGNLLRHGIIHYQITDSIMHARMARLGILALVQPVFLDYDMHIAENRVGKELASTSYAFGTLARLGVPVSYGTDSPVEDCNPLPCLCCAVTRRDLSRFPAGGFYPQERVDVATAIDSYTQGSAFAEFKENVKGRLQPGQYADLILLERDIFTAAPEEISGIKVEMTMMNGKIVYERD